MNIFLVDKSPITSAQSLCDRHVVKMILESCQVLCAAFEKGSAPYKRTHYNHPCTVWARTSKQNYEWLIKHCHHLIQEYKFRYDNKNHKSELVLDWIIKNYRKLELPDTGLTEHPKCMPDQYKVDDVVQSYRNYYIGEKRGFATWKKRQIPVWFK